MVPQNPGSLKVSTCTMLALSRCSWNSFTTMEMNYKYEPISQRPGHLRITMSSTLSPVNEYERQAILWTPIPQTLDNIAKDKAETPAQRQHRRENHPAHPEERGLKKMINSLGFETINTLGFFVTQQKLTDTNRERASLPWYHTTPFKVMFCSGWIMAFQRTECVTGPATGSDGTTLKSTR